MSTTMKPPFVTQAKNLSALDKMKLVNLLLEELDRPDPQVEQLWATESKRRLRAMRSGKMKTYTLDEVFGKARK